MNTVVIWYIFSHNHGEQPATLDPDSCQMGSKSFAAASHCRCCFWWNAERQRRKPPSTVKDIGHGLWCLWQFSVFGYRSADLVNMTSQPSPLQSTTLPSWRPALMNKNKHIKQVLGLYSSWWLNRRVQKLPMVPSCVNISTILVFGVRSLLGTMWVDSPRLSKESRTEIYGQCTFLNKNNSNCQFHISKQQTISGNFLVGLEVASKITGSWTNKIYAWPSKMRGPNIWDPPMPA